MKYRTLFFKKKEVGMMSQNVLSAAVVISALRAKLLAEPHLVFLSFKGGCTGPPEFPLVEKPTFWESHVATQLCFEPANDFLCCIYRKLAES